MRHYSATLGTVLPLWFGVCAVLLAFAAALVVAGDRFQWEREIGDIPTLWLAAGLSAAGMVYALFPALIRPMRNAGTSRNRIALGLILVTGLAMRLIMIPAVPALEDDFYRYLWDGAVTAHGLNPYALAPAAARSGAAPAAIQALAEDGVLVLDRVNHPDLKTIYPPIAQAAFAVAHRIEPWSLRAWRLVCLVGECASLGMILVLLAMTGRPLIWVALYWLNPLVVKELMNGAHMEAIVMPFVLGALVLLAGRRPVMASAALGLAIGAKLWPALLLPLVLRPLLRAPWRLAAALAILGGMAALWTLPPLAGGLGADSGFVAYAARWQTNSALFEALQSGVRFGLGSIYASDTAAEMAGTLVRGICVGAAGVIALWVSRDVGNDTGTVVQRALIIVLAMFLLSPAQFPWYAAWVLVFAPLLPLATLFALTVFMPLYYVSFHLLATDAYDTWNVWLVRAEWIPTAAALVWDARRAWQQPLVAELGSTGVPGKRM